MVRMPSWSRSPRWSKISIVVLVAICLIVLAGYMDWYRIVFGDHQKNFQIGLPVCDSPENADKGLVALREHVLARINHEFGDWRNDKDRNKFVYFIMSIFVTLSAMMATVLIALREGKILPSWKFWPVVLIGLPAMTASVSASLEQFKLRQIWEIRADGIYNLETLAAEFLLYSCTRDKLMDINERLAKLEQRQSTLDHIMDRKLTPEDHRKTISNYNKNPGIILDKK